ncbi:hypothetical protein M0802_008345 [Mischocyttarus mexicanus]|nr:hypothetical protein M0802_008345 [Mischocyttarus mexicanus]
MPRIAKLLLSRLPGRPFKLWFAENGGPRNTEAASRLHGPQLDEDEGLQEMPGKEEEEEEKGGKKKSRKKKGVLPPSPPSSPPAATAGGGGGRI